MTQVQRLVLAGLLAVGAWAVIDQHLLTPERTLFFVALVLSVVVHEASHAAAAYAFGDDTAKRAGRLTLNPLPHIDPWGSIVLPAVLIFTTGAAFGYARPVPVNPRRMRSPRNHGLLVALAGPATNVMLALLAALILQAVPRQRPGWTLAGFAYELGVVNVILAVFNLLPIPPLDGSALIERVLPAKLWPKYLRLRQYSFGLLLIVVFVLPLDKVFEPAFRLWDKLLP
jgi:Zn-dependent protease